MASRFPGATRATGFGTTRRPTGSTRIMSPGPTGTARVMPTRTAGVVPTGTTGTARLARSAGAMTAAVPAVAATTGFMSPRSATVTRPPGSTGLRAARSTGTTGVTGPTWVTGPTGATGSARVINDRRWPVDDCRSVGDVVRGYY
jgi:hypothetical protein